MVMVMVIIDGAGGYWCTWLLVMVIVTVMLTAYGATALNANVHCCSYVHRVGRTGRAGQSGVALTLFTAQDTDLQTQLCSSLRNPTACTFAFCLYAVHAVPSVWNVRV